MTPLNNRILSGGKEQTKSKILKNRKRQAERPKRNRKATISGEVDKDDTHQDSPHCKIADNTQPPDSSTTQITYGPSDILTAPNNALLVHATNCMGEWGSGVALALNKRLPSAFQAYKELCDEKRKIGREEDGWGMAGTCLLIPPQPQDLRKAQDERYWVACLFTSVGYGRKTKGKPARSSKKEILRWTETALGDLRQQLGRLRKAGEADAEAPGEIWTAKFNSGSFGVPWEKSEKILREVFGDVTDRDLGEVKFVVCGSAEATRAGSGGGARGLKRKVPVK